MRTHKTEVSRYYEVCERLDEARLGTNERRVKLLAYAVDILAEEAREALQKERDAIKAGVDQFIIDIAGCFGKDRQPAFPSITPNKLRA